VHELLAGISLLSQGRDAPCDKFMYVYHIYLITPPPISFQELPRLHELLAGISHSRRGAMRRAMRSAWPSLLWPTDFHSRHRKRGEGEDTSYLGEDGSQGALPSLFEVLRRRAIDH